MTSLTLRSESVAVAPGAIKVGVWIQAYIYLGLAFYSKFFDRLLAGNSSSYVSAAPQDAPLIQVVGLLLIALTVLLLLFRRSGFSANSANLATVLLVAWAVASALWSPQPDLAVRRSIALSGTIGFAYVVLGAVTKEQLLTILARLAVAFILISAVLMVLVPGYAFHQAADFGVGEQAGRLRGSYAHKNEFARILAFAVIVCAFFGRRVIDRKALWLTVLAVGFVMLVLAGSAKVFGAVPLAFAVGYALTRVKSAPVKVALLITVTGAAGLFLTLVDLDALLARGFEALGRDASLNGRDLIWRAAGSAITDHFWLGQGYGTGWRAGAWQLAERLTGQSLGHAHNGYIQLMVDLGAIGLFLALVPNLRLMGRLLGNYASLDAPLVGLLGAWLTFFLLVNSTGSYLFTHNDIFTVMLVFATSLSLRLSGNRVVV